MRLIDAEQYAKRIYEHINTIETCPARSRIEKNKEQQQWKDALYDLVQMPIVNPYEWISVEDRLPEDELDVLCWYEYFKYGDYNCIYQTYGIGHYNRMFNMWCGDVSTGHKCRVIAWIPLPAPPTENSK